MLWRDQLGFYRGKPLSSTRLVQPKITTAHLANGLNRLEPRRDKGQPLVPGILNINTVPHFVNLAHPRQSVSPLVPSPPAKSSPLAPNLL